MRDRSSTSSKTAPHVTFTRGRNSCGFALEESDVVKVRESAARYRNERVKADLTDMEYTEREKIARGHRLHSRAFFVASTLRHRLHLHACIRGGTLAGPELALDCLRPVGLRYEEELQVMAGEDGAPVCGRGRSGSGSSTKNGSADETLSPGGGTSRFFRFRTDAERQPGNLELR